MPPTRRKHPTLRIVSDEILPSRRSSLKVNLSYVSSLSDSGNGSFRSIQPENEEPPADRSLRRIVPAKIPEKSNFEVSPEVQGTITMSQREMALDESCRLLKDVIMNKTREIFDGRTELAVKTASILKGQRQALREINEDSKTADTRRKVISKSITRNPGPRNRSDGKTSRIDSSRRGTLKSSIFRASKSPILGGSDKSRDNGSSMLGEKVLRVRLTRIDPRLDSSMESGITDIGAPITCSSFIAGHGNLAGTSSRRIENDLPAIIDNSDPEESTENVEASSLMKITAIQGRLASTSQKCLTNSRLRGDTSQRREKSSDDRSSDELVPMELTSVQSHIPIRVSSSSEKTTRTSLNVNTSQRSRVSVTRNSRSSRGTSVNSESDNSQNNRTAQISLKVNTSIETEEREISNSDTESSFDDNDSARSRTRNVEKSGVIISDSDTDSMENISLIARLRDISTKNHYRANRSAAGEGPSFVEGTPYPPSRSILWRTRIRSKTNNPAKSGTSLKGNFATKLANNSSEPSDSDSSISPEYTTAPNSTIILGDSPCRINCNTANPKIIQDSSSEEDESAKPTSLTNPNENSKAAVEKTGKKKLLPLRDNFEIVSFSPVSPPEPSSKKPITWKPRKHFRKRKCTRAVAERRIEDSRREDEDDEPGRSSIGEIKTHKGKTNTKKPRKVISKKIVVKKVAGNEMLEYFGRRNSEQSAAGERSSMSEFLKKKRFSVAGRNLKPQKLVIVATGFSKGDVDLVKSVVKELGGAELNSTVSRRTTHVVSTGVRTINLLRGIIRGCWMISLDWVLRSLENKKWLNAEQYEMVHFSKAVQENRRDKQIYGKAYVPELFTTCGPIHIEHGTSPPPEILKELVKTAGGRIAENPKNARLSVGKNGLREIWILDSITTGDLQPIDEYQRK